MPRATERGEEIKTKVDGKTEEDDGGEDITEDDDNCDSEEEA